MNILIYIPYMDQKWGGVKQYSTTLLRVLNKDLENHYFIYHDVHDQEILDAAKDIPNHSFVSSNEINNNKKSRKKNISFSRVFNFLRSKIKRKTDSPVEDNFSLYCANKSIQVIHCPYQFIPFAPQAKLICTLHDVQELHFPEFFSAKERATRAKNYLDYLVRADHVIVSYNHIKSDLKKYFLLPDEKISVILLQMDKLWFYKYENSVCIDFPENVKDKKYILYPANTWEHKNHIAFIQVIAALRDEENIIVNLICTGHITDKYGSFIINKAKELNLECQVQFLGIVSESLLFSLYKNAVGVAIPTLYEAGSFPLIESIFLGVPVICSDVTSLPETIGSKDFIFDPKDRLSFKNKLRQLWLDENFRKKSIMNSSLQKQKLIETGAFSKLKETYQSLAS